MKLHLLFVFGFFILQGCASTQGPSRLSLPVVSLEKGEEFWCASGSFSFFLGKDKVVVADLNGKKHDVMGVIVEIKKSVMKDKSIDYSIRFATREIFSEGKMPEYSYRIDYMTFNSELDTDGFMTDGFYTYHMLSFPSIPKLHTANIRKKAHCKSVPDGYILMTHAESEMSFNNDEAF